MPLLASVTWEKLLKTSKIGIMIPNDMAYVKRLAQSQTNVVIIIMISPEWVSGRNGHGKVLDQ